MRSVRTSVALLAALVAFTACSEEPAAPTTSPSSAFGPETPPAATGSTDPAAGATDATGALPTTSPGAATGTLTSGEVTFAVTGDVAVHGTLRELVSAAYAPPPGGFAIVWQAGGTDPSVVGIGGASFTGTRPTTPSLSLSLTTVTTGGLASFLSMDGECSITIDVAAEDELSGGFACDELTGATGEVVDVTASFAATG
ncbi:MAG: hypothetical protein ACXWX0_07760 [Actinomycetota bacterium]